MRIGRVAQQADVNIQTLRYYERRGLLPHIERLASGYREYDVATVPLVRFIKNAQELGFTLREIGELVELRANRSRSQGEVRQLANEKIEEMDRRIRQLVSMKDELNELVERCNSGGPKGECVIIDAMDESNSKERRVGKRKSSNGGNHVAR